MPELIPRSAVFGPLTPTNNDGSPRPLLAPGLMTLTVHYTGSGGSFSDAGDTFSEIRSIQAYAAGPKRTPWEYNYVVSYQGEVVEYAGAYQAAHSAGENSTAIGVLFLLEVGMEPSVPQVDGFRWLRWALTQWGSLAPGHSVVPHRNMPGAATTCPGDAVMRHWNELLASWDDPLAEMRDYADQKLAANSMPDHNALGTGELKSGDPRNQDAYLLQVVLAKYPVTSPGNPDGLFGPRTAASLKDLQERFLRITPGDGRYGPVSHLRLQQLANDLAGA